MCCLASGLSASFCLHGNDVSPLLTIDEKFFLLLVAHTGWVNCILPVTSMDSDHVPVTDIIGCWVGLTWAGNPLPCHSLWLSYTQSVYWCQVRTCKLMSRYMKKDEHCNYVDTAIPSICCSVWE